MSRFLTKDSKIGRITPGGQITQFALPADEDTVAMTAGPGGMLWVSLTDEMGRLSLNGQITVFALPRGSFALQMTAGPAGTLWFTEYDNNQIGRFTPPR